MLKCMYLIKQPLYPITRRERYTIYTIQYTHDMYIVKCTLYICTVYNVHFQRILYSVYCILYIV